MNKHEELSALILLPAVSLMLLNLLDYYEANLNYSVCLIPQMAIIPRTQQGHGWLRPAIGVIELSQSIIQVYPDFEEVYF